MNSSNIVIKPFKLVEKAVYLRVVEIFQLFFQLTVNSHEVSFHELLEKCHQLSICDRRVAKILIGYILTHPQFAVDPVKIVIPRVFHSVINELKPEDTNQAHSVYITELMPILWNNFKTNCDYTDVAILKISVEILSDYFISLPDDAFHKMTSDNFTVMYKLVYNLCKYDRTTAEETYRKAKERATGTSALAEANIHDVFMYVRRTMSN